MVKLGSFVAGTFIAVFAFFAIANAVFVSPSNSAGLATAKTINAEKNALPVAGEVQTIYLSAVGINYSPAVIKVKQNVPVRIVADMQNLQGCLRSFVIPGFGIRKIFSAKDNVLEFTPTQKGSFAFSCSMGMGKGTLVVA